MRKMGQGFTLIELLIGIMICVIIAIISISTVGVFISTEPQTEQVEIIDQSQEQVDQEESTSPPQLENNKQERTGKGKKL